LDELRTAVEHLCLRAREREGQGDFEGAVILLEKAGVLAEPLGDHALVGELLVECARSFVQMGEYRQALRFLDRARDIARERGTPELKGEVYRGFGTLYKARGALREAEVCFDRALEHLEFSSRHASTLRALIDLCEVYLKDGRYAQAGALLKRAANLPQGADGALRIRLALNLGRVAFLGGDLAGAISQYEDAARSASLALRSSDRELVSLGLSGLYLQAGRLGEAAQSLREALALSIVACSQESAHALERSRLHACAQRLLEIDEAANRAGAAPAVRRALNDAVLLFDAHPLVLSGELPPYGHTAAALSSKPDPPSLETDTNAIEKFTASTRSPNPK
jgi:tetratricopeptide (TPR) repeat protein